MLKVYSLSVEAAMEQLLRGEATPSISDVHSCFENFNDPFSSLQTKHQQTKYYREVFGLIVSYVEKTMHLLI